MTESPNNPLTDARVATVALSDYERGTEHALWQGCESLGWANETSPFGAAIPRGARVLIKPNFVAHENQGPWGLSPLVTHPSLVRAVAEAALHTEATQVLVGDAPLQACDWDKLLHATELDVWATELRAREPRFAGIEDFRRTTCSFVNGARVATENLLPEERFVLFDLGEESLLEPITTAAGAFRVTCYDPRLLARTHAPGRHQYLVTRAALEADVVINLPKLKTHKKAGITGALKNLVGINGNKEYLPHHRIGGAGAGGDCYPGRSLTKRALEYAFDREHTATSSTESELWRTVERQLQRALRLTGDRLGVEGSWAGNDTVWRMSLDLNRILLYGHADGTLADAPQRRVLHVVDAVVAGQGDGPLAPQPLPLGLLLAGANAAALDWAGAQLLGYDPARVPIVREAFGDFYWPLASFAPQMVAVMGDAEAMKKMPVQVLHPVGWRDAAQKSVPRAVESAASITLATARGTDAS
ncbi:MAG TPA: DUF362 domain-containing protein [Blastocatellia bacterium]|nr:DUF362 domain-containing protein [Blastocatellia bacterium]HMZ20942.1 DUF362 domain-containing protein [Blastocatellia bacterium]HNG34246.1 DUF362 domain-containing protein [Blastocatellia bacterium]